jgi:hypothetical protein
MSFRQRCIQHRLPLKVLFCEHVSHRYSKFTFRYRDEFVAVKQYIVNAGQDQQQEIMKELLLTSSLNGAHIVQMVSSPINPAALHFVLHFVIFSSVW